MRHSSIYRYFKLFMFSDCLEFHFCSFEQIYSLLPSSHNLKQFFPLPYIYTSSELQYQNTHFQENAQRRIFQASRTEY